MSLSCPDCGERVQNLMAHVCRKGKSSDGGGESRPAIKEQRIEKSTVNRDRKTRVAAAGHIAGVAPGPSDWESLSPEELAKKHPVTAGEYKGVVIRPDVKSKRGRPRIGEVRDKPWEALGMSERTYYRRKGKP